MIFAVSERLWHGSAGALGDNSGESGQDEAEPTGEESRAKARLRRSAPVVSLLATMDWLGLITLAKETLA